jgi:hypothetical protein
MGTHRMTDVTVLLLDGTFSSTAIGPMEVFSTRANYGTFLRASRRFLAFG